MFNISDENLKSLGAYNTVREIQSQPRLWKETFKLYEENKENIKKFIENIVKKDNRKLRVIFTGAGTSAYVGDTIVQHLKTLNDEKIVFESIATTDLVSCPYNHFNSNDKILLVSFARSGNSPESLQAVKLANQIVKDIYHMPITCARTGKLAVGLAGKENAMVLTTPEESNDKGFAMTSSFTCMMLYSLMIFDNIDESKKEAMLNTIIKMADKLISDESYVNNIVENNDFNRVVYLGSGVLGSLTREAQLKLLELTAGEITALYETSMGFRHGPKSYINDKTIVVSFVSSNPYTQKYDLDIISEIRSDQIASHIELVSQEDLGIENNYNFGMKESIADEYAAFPYIIFAHILAVRTSLKVNNTPDTPSKSGTVNRVVKGVIIHEYEA
ncbi:MAG: SIS domain-containing protein [Peptostreptococcus sp.]|uniref:SIS domain-containing protein n=1 Tax=Peptostreptococcus sp. TaxID=1262 RepID=UPI002FC652D0